MLTRCPDWDAIKPRACDKEAREAYKWATKSAPTASGLQCKDVLSWHKAMFRNFTPRTASYYAGNFRQVSSVKPCLNGVSQFGPWTGTCSAKVVDAMQAWQAGTNDHIQELDRLSLAGDEERLIDCLVRAVARISGEFIRIHPFVNGNGRTSRLICAWVFWRYGYTIKGSGFADRPPHPYVDCMHHAVAGNFRNLETWLYQNIMRRSPRAI